MRTIATSKADYEFLKTDGRDHFTVLEQVDAMSAFITLNKDHRDNFFKVKKYTRNTLPPFARYRLRSLCSVDCLRKRHDHL